MFSSGIHTAVEIIPFSPQTFNNERAMSSEHELVMVVFLFLISIALWREVGDWQLFIYNIKVRDTWVKEGEGYQITDLLFSEGKSQVNNKSQYKLHKKILSEF